MGQPYSFTPFAARIQELASQVVFALRGGDHRGVVAAGGCGECGTALAAVRVLGADALLPSLLPQPPADEDRAVFEQAVATFPPAAAPSSAWSHRAMLRTLATDEAEPGTQWLDAASWQVLAHQLAVLAALAVPGFDCGVTRVAAGRPADVAAVSSAQCVAATGCRPPQPGAGGR